MSGTIMASIRDGALSGWGLEIRYNGWPGALGYVTVTVTAPAGNSSHYLTSGIAVGADADEYDEIVAAIRDGDDRRGSMRTLAEWLVDRMRRAVENPDLFWLPLSPPIVDLWRQLVDRADHGAAEWYARYGNHQTRPRFEIVGSLLCIHDQGQPLALVNA